jgi:hypothetical protein
MITLELDKRNWNTKYVQYDPKKWVVSIVHNEGGLNVEAMTYDAKDKRSYGYFYNVHIRTTPIPKYIPKSDIEVWD